MAGEQRAVTIRFNMGDRTDRELYRKLAEGAGDAVSRSEEHTSELQSQR